MKLTQALVVTCLLAQVLCQAGAKKRKSRGGKKDWRLARLQQLISPMQEDIKELQELVETLSNPIHIHMHGLSRVETSAVENRTRHTHEEDRYDDHGDDHDDDHGDDHGHKHHGRGHRHGRHHKHGERKRKCKKCKPHGEKKRTDEEDKDHGDDDDDDDEGGKQNQRHIHIHLNVAPSGDGGDRRESCLTEEDEHAKDEYKHGCCKVFPNSESGLGMQGNIYLRHKPHSQMEVKVILKDSGSAPGRSMHGIHVHEFADVSNGCNAFGGHYNPKGHNHGGPDAEEKHPGDWGNLEAEDGVIVTAFNVSGTLFGRESMIGRGIVIHAGTDDLGKGENHESHKTGNAGARIACCAITLCEGHLNPNLGLGE